MRHLAIALLLILTGASVAFAGDAATLRILGFSKDGSIFAFEEFGVQDGSGFPFANRFYIDTNSDKFLPGTPIRVRIDEEDKDVSAAREKASQAGQSIVTDQELALNLGFTAASNSITEISADPHQFQFLPRPVFPPIDDEWALRLEEIDFPPAEACPEKLKGFRLLLLNPAKPTETKVLAEDTSIPKSRNCPLGYKLGAVQTLYLPDGSNRMAVLIAVESVGFEGPNHRWIAVTGRL
ncbi:MAG: DUF2259 domain-containing protein [Rhizobiaceae bacterium]|nr:DUF2259 domain-containing protein [Rhizobiaceae bacterium]